MTFGITRRQVLKTSMAGAAAAIWPIPSNASAAPGADCKNVLMIIADDTNDYGFYDTFPIIKMPSLRQFKRTAVTFDKAYCAAPACVPSRAAVFSGLYPTTRARTSTAVTPGASHRSPRSRRCPNASTATVIQPSGEEGAWDSRIIEGPNMVKINGTYYLFWSATGWGYTVGYATAKNVWGPYVKHLKNPIYGAARWN